MIIRTGIGVDVHALAEGNELVLGGVQINHFKGTVAHSDGDVLIHAICDALLGAAALGDIGHYFPDTNDEWLNRSSLDFLVRCNELIKDEGYSISNLDSTVILQRPKLAPFIPQMREQIAIVLNLEVNQVNVKATTSEYLGFEGKEQGVTAYATVTLIK